MIACRNVMLACLAGALAVFAGAGAANAHLRNGAGAYVRGGGKIGARSSFRLDAWVDRRQGFVHGWATWRRMPLEPDELRWTRGGYNGNFCLDVVGNEAAVEYLVTSNGADFDVKLVLLDNGSSGDQIVGYSVSFWPVQPPCALTYDHFAGWTLISGDITIGDG
jgi:hypothetical protein